MDRLKWIGLLVVLLIVASAPVNSAGKVTSDPNAPGIQRPAVRSEEIDARLARKITYDSGYRRLHAVADDIAKLSGVSVACGKSPKDWRVRDIPLVVCVKDMPLGKLLRAVADATHTRVALEKVANDPAKHYRIYRRLKEEQAIENLTSARHEAKLAQVQWQWDALTAYGRSGKEIPDVQKTLLPFGKLIAALGPDAKRKMLDGDMFVLRGTDPAYKSTMVELMQAFWDDRVAEVGEKARNVPAPSAKDAESAVVALKMADEGDMGTTTLDWGVRPCPALGPDMDVGFHFGSASALDGKLPGMPPYPKDPEVPDPEVEIDNPELVFMAKDKPEEWGYPLLTAKIDVVKPKDLKDATFADAMRALANASGCNIVAEDFVSHMVYSSQNVESVFAKDTTAADRLRVLRINGYRVQYNWFFGKGSKLFVGWASYDSGDTRFRGSWHDHHRALLPEKYLADFKRKLDGPGVQFDDAASLVNVTWGSHFEWFIHSRDLGCMDMLRPVSNVALWKLYDSLSAEDKALAKSDAGLRLAKLDRRLTTQFLRSSRMSQMAFPPGPNDVFPSGAKLTLDQEATSDPSVISTMVIHVTGAPAAHRARHLKPGFGADAFVGEDVSPVLKLSRYTIRIDYTLNGKKQAVENMITVPLPLYSTQREAEIIKAASEKTTAK